MIKRRKWGYTILVVLAMLPLLIAIFGSMLNSVETEVRLAQHDVNTLRAELLAEDSLQSILASQKFESMTLEGESGSKAMAVTTVTAAGDGYDIIVEANVDRPTGRYRALLRAQAEKNAAGVFELSSFSFD